MRKWLLATFALITVFFLLFLKTYSPMSSDSSNQVFDGIVLLGGQYKERVPKAAELFKKGYAPLILLANDGVLGGWSSEYQRNLYHIEQSEELLVQLGVPRESIIKLPYYKSGTIYDTAAAKNYASDHGLRSLLLVTSDYHAYRALWIFRRVFRGMPVTITVSEAPSSIISLPRFMEPIKIVYYYVRFGIFKNILV